MHRFLKSIGFSSVTKRSEMKQIVCDVVKNYDEKLIVENHEDGAFAEFSKNYASDCGITVCGQYDENNRFHPDYWFPFFKGSGITSEEDVIIERHAEKESKERTGEKKNKSYHFCSGIRRQNSSAAAKR